jgi:tetratricopeptide (TPR) repeat protein
MKKKAPSVGQTFPPGKKSATSDFWLESIPTYKILIALALLVMLAYANSLQGEFVFDDTKQILNNPTLRGPVDIFQAFTTDVWAFQKSYSTDIPPPYYRPLFTLWLNLGYRLFGLWPPGWHLLSVLVHLLATILLFYTVIEVTRHRALAALAAVFFAVHPIHSESVSWVSAIPDLLLAVFFLPSLLFYFRARTTGRISNWMWSFFFYALSTLCKENALSLPLIVLGTELLIPAGRRGPGGGRSVLSSLRPAIVRVSGYVGISLLYLVARYRVLGLITWQHPFDQDLTNLIALITVPKVLLTYLWHLVFPFDLSLFYDVLFVRSLASPSFIFPLLLVAGMGTVWFLWWRKLKAEGEPDYGSFVFATLLLLAPMLPVLNLKAFHEEYLVQDRYMYLPSIGLCLFIGLVLLSVGRRIQKAAISNGVLLVIVASLLFGTILQNRVWSDSVSLWIRARDHRSNSWHAHYNLGLALLLHHRYLEAEAELRVAAGFAPNNPLVFTNLGLAETYLFKNDAAIQDFQRAILLEPTMAEPYINLGDLHYRLNQPAAAEENFRKALHLQPRSTVALYNLARLHADRGDLNSAFKEWQQLLDLSPEDADARYHYGLTLKRMDRADEAKQQWKQALAEAKGQELRKKIQAELERP